MGSDTAPTSMISPFSTPRAQRPPRGSSSSLRLCSNCVTAASRWSRSTGTASQSSVQDEPPQDCSRLGRQCHKIMSIRRASMRERLRQRHDLRIRAPCCARVAVRRCLRLTAATVCHSLLGSCTNVPSLISEYLAPSRGMLHGSTADKC
jgi:hypothetical protein